MIERALDVFWRQGLVGTTMQDLADAASVQRGSLYNAYGGKDAIFALAFDRYADRFIATAMAALDCERPQDALTAFFAVAIANMTDGTPARGCLTTRTLVEATTVDAAVGEKATRLLERLEKLLLATFSRPGFGQVLRLPPAAAAEVTVVFTRGLAVMERAGRKLDELKMAARSFVDALAK